MMKLKKALWVILPALVVSFGFYLKVQDTGEEVLLKAITENLFYYHYDPVDLDNDFSKKAYTLYIKTLDPNKRLFIQKDIDVLEEYQTKIDDQIKDGSYEFFDKTNELLKKRMAQTEEYFEDIMKEPFDFDKKEDVELSEDIPYVKDEKALKERWRKYLKYNVLTRVHKELRAQEKAKENKDSNVTIQPFDSLEAKARAGVLKTHRDWYKRLNRLNRKDRLSIYVNSITAVYDPHTNYYPPKDKENFDIQMSGQLEGIGAQLQEKDGYIKITNIIPGGPAALQGDLKENDLILKVAQENEEAVDIIDWRIDDAVKLIRGKKGTKVTLTVRKPDGSVKDIIITRDVVILEETFAKSLIIHDQDKKKAGYVYLPSFYADFRNPKGRFSWKDVKAEVEKLKRDGVEGIIIDLRNNGGGSLDDVVKMAGLFIDEGPVVQIKEKGRMANVMKDTKAGTDWDGPLVIMVNEFSASASEILAAAMQDYNRAVVIGSASTHGKGTVQRFLELNQSLRNKSIPNLGSIKLTTQKFYRINGDATQLKGVSSDVLLPDYYMYIHTGEKEHDYPMEWDQIESSTYDAALYGVPSNVISNSSARVAASPTFKLIEENARRWEAQREEKSSTLNLDKYEKEQEKEQEEEKKFSHLMKDPIEGFYAENPSADVEHINSDESREQRNEDWIKSILKDPYIYEALQIVEDWQMQLASQE
ncbi:tail-specific protease [bacterium]|nr:tail-specific protease [bacterium]